MADKLIDVKDAELVASGIVKSLHPVQAPLWVDGQNVVFEDGQVRKSPGYVSIIPAPGTEPVVGMIDILHGSSIALIFGDLSTLYEYSSETGLDSTSGYTAVAHLGAFQKSAFQYNAWQIDVSRYATQWSMESWGTWGLATNVIS